MTTHAKKIAVMLALGAAILGVFNYSIHAKEQIRRHGQTVLLELAPADPRSLMQGDYMQLGFAIERDAQKAAENMPEHIRRGYLVIAPDENGVGRLVRIDDGSALASDEKRVRFHRPYPRWVWVVPRSFFFQEGHRQYYDEAKYGIFKFDDAGNHILTGLADENRVKITPPGTHS